MLLLLAAAVLLVASPAFPQSLTPGPPGPFVIDLRAVTVGIPNAPEFYPAVPASAKVPARGWGYDVGAHVYLMQWGHARLGVGADVLRARGVARALRPVTPPGGAGSPPAASTVPDVEARVSGVAPQVSFNFGSREGWSYLSGGAGVVSIETATTNVAQPRSKESGRTMAINYGGGARWFLTSHIAVGFDLRFHRFSASGAAGTPGATMVAASFGLGFR